MRPRPPAGTAAPSSRRHSRGRLPDFFDPWPEVDNDPILNRQSQIWQALVHAEAVGDQVTVLSCLRALGWQLYESGKVLRAREVALAHLAAAVRAADVMEQLGAKWLLGNASRSATIPALAQSSRS